MSENDANEFLKLYWENVFSQEKNAEFALSICDFRIRLNADPAVHTYNQSGNLICFFKESKYGCSVPQTADWDNFYAVRPRVCKLAAGNDHQQIRFAEIRFAGSICGPHKLLDLK